MLAKILIALVSFATGAFLTALGFNETADKARRKGWDEGWDRCRESKLIRYLHWQEYNRTEKQYEDQF